MKRRMRVGIFTDTYYPEISGVATSVYELRNSLIEAGQEVFVFTVSNHEVDPTDSSETHVYRIPSMPFVTLKERRIGIPILKNYLKIIKKFNLDLIHTHTEFSLGGLGKRAAAKFNLPHIHTYHTLYENYMHYLKIPENDFTYSLVGKFIKKFTKNCDLIIVPTEKVIDSMRGYKVERPLKVIPTGLDLDKFRNIDWKKVEEIRSRYEIKSDDTVLISICRVSQEKKLDQIIRFFHELSKTTSKIKLMIVGDGPAKTELEELSTEFGLNDKVVFTGYADWERIQDYYAAGNIFVSASQSETQGLTYAEALSTGIPILVRQDDCLKDVLYHKENGYGFTNKDDFIRGFHYINDKLAEDSSWGSHSEIFSKQDFIDTIISTYEEVCSNHKEVFLKNRLG
ncbi:MAG TPA: glycosyltransferase family 4 protein [Clostridiaceae bacterium]|nr:glycosyltransferase family 4 protein [Clostridiaceae bacterium]